uniref:Uncharacterized protein n=1 Tax=Tanacetum cinerariifolium TaxID=118510 RepID=A0A699WFW6_TANCI|nr:hypothetical protein [Tanacetum cinerariifolium]
MLKMSKDDKYLQLAFDRQLVSVMNRTKWRELVDILGSNPDFTPQIRLKYIDGKAPDRFSYLDSYLIKFGGFTRAIEWFEINPILRERVGLLVAHKETDFSDWVREALTSYFIPFVEADCLFRINGYLQPSVV